MLSLQFKEIFQMIIYTVLTGCGVAITYKLLTIVNTQIDKLQAKLQLDRYKYLNAYIDAAQNAVTTAVASVAQTYTDSLKASGKFDKEAQKAAKDMAISIANDLICDKTAEAIQEVYGDFDVYLEHMVELAVKELKK